MTEAANTEAPGDDSACTDAADGQGFVAGTLVHTSEGLRPIEQIKVADLVLSRPDTGEGETSFQPVTRVFEYEDREVYWINISEIDESFRFLAGFKEEGVAVTGAHPIWIDHYRQKSWEGEDVVTSVNGWVNVEEYYFKALSIRENAEHDNRLSEPKAYGRMTNGRLVRNGVPIPILKGKALDEGVWFFDYPDWDGAGAAVRFDSRGVSLTGKDVGLGWNAADANYDYTGYDTTSPMSVVVRSKGHLPIRRTVHNLEVANNHSFFVGELGLWVHNTSGVEIRLPLKPTQRWAWDHLGYERDAT